MWLDRTAVPIKYGWLGLASSESGACQKLSTGYLQKFYNTTITTPCTGDCCILYDIHAFSIEVRQTSDGRKKTSLWADLDFKKAGYTRTRPECARIAMLSSALSIRMHVGVLSLISRNSCWLTQTLLIPTVPRTYCCPETRTKDDVSKQQSSAEDWVDPAIELMTMEVIGFQVHSPIMFLSETQQLTQTLHLARHLMSLNITKGNVSRGGMTNATKEAATRRWIEYLRREWKGSTQQTTARSLTAENQIVAWLCSCSVEILNPKKCRLL